MARGLLPVCLVLLFVLPAAAAAEWGVHEVDGDATIEMPGVGESYWVCVAALPHRDEVVLQQGDTERVFHPTAGRAACRTLPGEPLIVTAGDGAIRVLVLSQSPRDASGPGVFRLVSSGVALSLDDASSAAEVGILRAGEVTVELVRRDTLEVVAAVAEGKETRFQLDEEVADAGLLVVVKEAGGEDSALVEWSDPDWYRRAPTIGHLAVVVAIALFLVLYHGRGPRRLG